jgi:release factor glutamine methyltransferase
MTGAEFITALDNPVPARAGAYLASMVERRASGEPLQYTLGSWSFRTLDLMVDRRVLIPRPETEIVAGIAIEEAKARRGDRVTVVDLGTGSGAIALSIAAEVPGAEVWGTDVSEDALEVARANLCGLGGFAATRVRLVCGSWFDALPDHLAGCVDILVANPPYIADEEMIDSTVDRWEPRVALRSGPTGLEAIAAILGDALRWTTTDGVVVLEIAPHQTGDAQGLASRAGFRTTEVFRDLAERDRVLVARR